MSTSILFSRVSILSMLLVSVLSADPIPIKDIFDAVNKIRTDPKSMIVVIQNSYLNHIVNGVHQQWSRTMFENKAAVNNAIQFLNTVTPLPALTPNKAMTEMAYRHTEYLVEEQKQSHIGRGSTTLGDRFNEYSTTWNRISENVQSPYSSWITNGTLAVLEWVIDDGVSGRGHRLNIFNADVTEQGVAVIIDPKKPTQFYSTQVFAKGFTCSETTICSKLGDKSSNTGWDTYEQQKLSDEQSGNSGDESSNPTTPSTPSGNDENSDSNSSDTNTSNSDSKKDDSKDTGSPSTVTIVVRTIGIIIIIKLVIFCVGL